MLQLLEVSLYLIPSALQTRSEQLQMEKTLGFLASLILLGHSLARDVSLVILHGRLEFPNILAWVRAGCFTLTLADLALSQPELSVSWPDGLPTGWR